MSGIALQVKTGRNKDLLNNSAQRNRIKYGKGGMEFQDTLLWKLYADHHIYLATSAVADGKTVLSDSKSSSVIGDYLNYALGDYIARTNLMKNDLYLTLDDGFITASEWMKKHQKILAFNDHVDKLTNGLLQESGSYSFKGLDKN